MATQRGQSPALILSRFGFTVYGTTTEPIKYLPEVDSYIVPGRVVPSAESYFLYKQLKKIHAASIETFWFNCHIDFVTNFM